MKQRVLCLAFESTLSQVVMYQYETPPVSCDGTNPFWEYKTWPLVGEMEPGQSARSAASKLFASVSGIRTEGEWWTCFYTDHRFEGNEKVVTYCCTIGLSDDAVRAARPPALPNVLTGFMDGNTIRGLLNNNNKSLPHQMSWLAPMAQDWLRHPESR